MSWCLLVDLFKLTFESCENSGDCCRFVLVSLHLLCLKVVKTAMTTAILCQAVCVCWVVYKASVCVVEAVVMPRASPFLIFFSKEWTNMAVLAWAQISGWPVALLPDLKHKNKKTKTFLAWILMEKGSDACKWNRKWLYIFCFRAVLHLSLWSPLMWRGDCIVDILLCQQLYVWSVQTSLCTIFYFLSEDVLLPSFSLYIVYWNISMPVAFKENIPG